MGATPVFAYFNIDLFAPGQTLMRKHRANRLPRCAMPAWRPFGD